MTKDEAKRILSRLGFKHGVSPRIISTRLLSEEDKSDMLEEKITWEALDCAVELWKRHGMPDYAHGKTEPYQPEFTRTAMKDKISKKYRGAFVDYRSMD